MAKCANKNRSKFVEEKLISLIITMSREVVKDEYITEDSKRQKTFKRRRASIIKKAHDLSIICGLEVGAIVYSGDPSDPEPEVWPDHEGVQQTIERCQANPITQRILDTDESLQKKINKGKELLMRRRQENQIEEISQQMVQCMPGKTMPRLTDWHDMKMYIEQRSSNINRTSRESGEQVELHVPAFSMPKEFPVFRDYGMTTGQFQQFRKDVPVPTTSGMLQLSTSANPYIPTLQTSQGLTSQNQMLTNQHHLQYGMGMGNMEDYMGFGAYEMRQPCNNANYPYLPSSYNPFSP